MSDNKITGPGYYPRRPDRLRLADSFKEGFDKAMRQKSKVMNFSLPDFMYLPDSPTAAEAADTAYFSQAIGRIQRRHTRPTTTTAENIHDYLLGNVLGLREFTVTPTLDFEVTVRVTETDYEDRRSEDLVFVEVRDALTRCTPVGVTHHVVRATPQYYLGVAMSAGVGLPPLIAFSRMMETLRTIDTPREILDTLDMVTFTDRPSEVSCEYHGRTYTKIAR